MLKYMKNYIQHLKMVSVQTVLVLYNNIIGRKGMNCNKRSENV